ncbi:MAG: GTPase Obg/CgtA [Alphaproteobacteria bacterium MarineAlpha5_Bin9]|nr:MAG: GTPase Obg/CgtA [Alphaproteobacteria bacterium MarineAlpha5_Bin9]|tara:strand:+ start:14308 stop:15276 length:969 start_codon:yes stop_codon:yes gene_type:complete
MKFLDEAKIYIKPGNGGKGCLSFRKEKYIEFGGPDGGNGGKGGDIIIKVEKNLNTLIDYRYKQHFKAKNGQNGKGKNKTGASGKNLIIKVPPGTQILNQDKSVIICDLINNEGELKIAEGGKGGYGNSNFKSSTNRAPRKTTKGEEVEAQWVWLSLKLLADIGIIGMPNAGKSTLLSLISSAKPKIADYPFTTLHPILGVVKKDHKEIVVADIPGLIEGAHEGKGIGDRFLAHIERCKSLLHIVDCSNDNFLDNYIKVRNELKKYGSNLNKKNEIIAISKIDLLNKNYDELIKLTSEKTGKKPILFSCFSGYGISELKKNLF